MKIITVLNTKGGVGKTTLVSNLAGAFLNLDSHFFRNILLVDTDKKQRSLMDWHNCATDSPYDIIGADTKAAMLGARRIGENLGCNVMIVDTAGKTQEVSGTAASISDLILIPLNATPLAVWATEDAVDLVRAVRSANPNCKALLVINDTDIKSTTLKTAARESMAESAPDIHFSNNVIHTRKAFAASVNEGGTAFDTTDAIAKGEIKNLAIEIAELMEWNL